MARTSRRTEAMASELVSFGSRNSSHVAGSVLTTGIGLPAESSEIARNSSGSVSAAVLVSTLCQKARSSAGSH